MSPYSVASPNRTQYLNRIERTIQFVNLHLSEPLELERLAGEAGFSPFHFHRLFSALVGESPQTYINRQRMERAANLLLKSPSLTMTDVALQCGFSTPSNFARSFKKYFGCTASAYAKRFRESGRPHSWVNVNSPLPDPSGFSLPDIVVRRMPALHLAYFSARRGYGADSIKEVWTRMLQWAASRGIDYTRRQMIAMAYDDPEITPPAKCRYLACLTVPEELKTDPRAALWDIPEHLCGVCRLAVDGPEIPAAYRAMYRDWLPDSGFLLADLPPYEIYYDAPDAHPGAQYVFDLCIPILAG